MYRGTLAYFDVVDGQHISIFKCAGYVQGQARCLVVIGLEKETHTPGIGRKEFGKRKQGARHAADFFGGGHEYTEDFGVAFRHLGVKLHLVDIVFREVKEGTEEPVVGIVALLVV